MRFTSGKTYTHAQGLSCAFRQWFAKSHCSKLHGYALKFEFVFGASELDKRNWVVDFGDLKELKEWLSFMFDHTTVVANDDPLLLNFASMEVRGALDLRVVPAVGCERFAQMAYEHASKIVRAKYGDRCWVESVTCREHEANSATCSNEGVVV